MKIKPDFKAVTAYDWKYFTKEDYTMYKDVLLAEPYNPELAEFFYEQKKLEMRLKRSDLRHCESSDTLENEPSTDMTDIIDLISIQSEFMNITPLEKRRLAMSFCEGKSPAEIARIEGVTLQSVYQAIRKAKNKIKNCLLKA